MAFVVSANVMKVKYLYYIVKSLALSFCEEYFLETVLKLLLRNLGLVVYYLCLLCAEELMHVELFTYPVVVPLVATLQVFYGVNFYDELDGAAVIQQVALDQVSEVMLFLTFGDQDFFVHLQVMEVLGYPTCLACIKTEQCVVVVNAH